MPGSVHMTYMGRNLRRHVLADEVQPHLRKEGDLDRAQNTKRNDLCSFNDMVGSIHRGN